MLLHTLCIISITALSVFARKVFTRADDHDFALFRLERGASKEQLTTRFVNIAIEYHPLGTEEQEKLQEFITLSEAYHRLHQKYKQQVEIGQEPNRSCLKNTTARHSWHRR